MASTRSDSAAVTASSSGACLCMKEGKNRPKQSGRQQGKTLLALHRIVCSHLEHCGHQSTPFGTHRLLRVTQEEGQHRSSPFLTSCLFQYSTFLLSYSNIFLSPTIDMIHIYVDFGISPPDEENNPETVLEGPRKSGLLLLYLEYQRHCNVPYDAILLLPSSVQYMRV